MCKTNVITTTPQQLVVYLTDILIDKRKYFSPRDRSQTILSKTKKNVRTVGIIFLLFMTIFYGFASY